jgi:hypothetical protein
VFNVSDAVADVNAAVVRDIAIVSAVDVVCASVESSTGSMMLTCIRMLVDSSRRATPPSYSYSSIPSILTCDTSTPEYSAINILNLVTISPTNAFIGNARMILAFTTNDLVITGGGVVVGRVVAGTLVVSTVSVVVCVVVPGVVVVGMVADMVVVGFPLTHVLAFMRPSVDHPLGQDLHRPEKAPDPVSRTISTGQTQTFSNATSVSGHSVHSEAFEGDIWLSLQI